MTISPDQDGWYYLGNELSPEAIEEIGSLAAPVNLKMTGKVSPTTALIKRLASLKVDRLWLWCDVNRHSMKYLVELPALRVLDICSLAGSGEMANFSNAHHLEEFRANSSMTEGDLLQLAQCGTLREIGAQNAALSKPAMSALLALPHIETLDLEATCFDDRMARWTSRSTTITSLELGGTRISAVGLEHLVRMQQLRSLDLWATNLNETHLALLTGLPNLEYVSLGGYDWLPSLDAEAVTSLLLGLPKLKRAWLDGVDLESSQRQALESKLDYLRLT